MESFQQSNRCLIIIRIKPFWLKQSVFKVERIGMISTAKTEFQNPNAQSICLFTSFLFSTLSHFPVHSSMLDLGISFCLPFLLDATTTNKTKITKQHESIDFSLCYLVYLLCSKLKNSKNRFDCLFRHGIECGLCSISNGIEKCRIFVVFF